MSIVGARGQKSKLLDWANDQQQLDMRAKYILKELASYADADCRAWAKVETLAYAANCSDRTVQNHLAALLRAGLIEKTDLTHRLPHSTRSVPVYQLAPGVAGLGAPFGAGSADGADGACDRACGMGAEISPIDAADGAHGCNPDGGMGETGLHPQRDQGDQEGADAPSPGARARAAAWEALKAAMPKRLLAVTDQRAMRAELDGLAEAGVDVAGLAGCMARWAVDPLFVGRKVPEPGERWLASGKWEAFVEAADGAAAEGAAVVTANGPPELPRDVADVVYAMGRDWVGSWLRRGRWDEATRTLVCALGLQRDEVRKCVGAKLTAIKVLVVSAAEFGSEGVGS